MSHRALPPKLDKNGSRVEWNSAWERYLHAKFSPACSARIAAMPLIPTMLRSLATPRMSTMAALTIASQTEEISKAQYDLACFAIPKLVSHHLEDEWDASPLGRREELVLEGLWRTAGVAPQIEEYRAWCPEMTVERLAGLGEGGFIDILKQLIPADQVTKMREPIFITHAVVDQIFLSYGAQENADLFVRQLRGQRCHFISIVIWYTLLAFYRLTEESYLSRPIKVTKELHSEVDGMTRKALLDSRLPASIFREYKTEMKEAVHVCANCKKGETQLEGQGLKKCADCARVGRSIRYCSKECQRADWKKGRPVPHRKICGKTSLGYDDIVPAEEPTQRRAERIPLPDASFRRPIALLHQISHLEKAPYLDYMVITPAPHDDVGISLTIGRREFLALRYKAMRNADPGAVAAMYCFLAEFAKTGMHRVTDELLRSQLEREYGVKLDAVPKTDGIRDLTVAELLIGQEIVERGVEW